MDHLLEAYASSSDDAESDGKTTATVSTLGELPMDVLGMFQDSGESNDRRPEAEGMCAAVWSSIAIACARGHVSQVAARVFLGLSSCAHTYYC